MRFLDDSWRINLFMHSFFTLLLALTMGAIWSNPLQAQDGTDQQSFYFGFALGGGLSAILNHNTFGFPKMDYNPSGVQLYGLNVGFAPQPWNRFQVGLNYSRGEYNYSDTYGPYAMSTESGMDMQKRISLELIQIPFTYRHYLFNQDKLMAIKKMEVREELTRTDVFYVLGGVQVSIVQSGNMRISKRSESTDGKWAEVDLIDLKPVFNSFIPVSKIPDYLPEDRTELFNPMLLEVMFGAGWNKKLGPRFDIGLECYGTISVTDVNSSNKAATGGYAWRRPYYLRGKPYRAAHLGTLGISAVMNFAL